MTSRGWIAAAALTLGLASPVAGLGPLEVGPVGAGVHAIDIAGFAYHPRIDLVGLGATVTWRNLDAASHTAGDELGFDWDSGNLRQGQAWSRTFHKPGAYVYACDYHPMFGVLVVAAEPGG